ncbi:MarR family winged helix-turn-helix transcriptional regulator [Fusibacter sp. 3D3]|uniref:MarR family winged helix-turn-helix transcriptional regulator n=1 Tax=Fusibacter sp. 3D3 TaxID=1048380 RepID=UPI0008536F11|nr:winged helix DNA-binding protein [Fusibacter sp. 3D3]GAU76570.1 putative transcriptional regulator, MarR family [Fusibacter sp. 3D3]
MSEYLKALTLVDLLSEKHKKLREEVLRLWHEENSETINDTESHLLAMVSKREITMAESARELNISRQAAHKCTLKLMDHGYISIQSSEANKRNKLLGLTPKGEAFCCEMSKIKAKIEAEIASNLGIEFVETMKNALRKNWINDKTSI